MSDPRLHISASLTRLHEYEHKHKHKHKHDHEHEHLNARRAGWWQQFEGNDVDDKIGNDEQRHDELWSQAIGTRGQGVTDLLQRDQRLDDFMIFKSSG